MNPEKFDRVVQLRLNQRQHRYLLWAAATDLGSQSYAPVVRELIDAAIENSPPKVRKQLDMSDDDFSRLLGDILT